MLLEEANEADERYLEEMTKKVKARVLFNDYRGLEGYQVRCLL